MSLSKLFFNGRIFTSRTGDEESHESMLIKDDKVVCVGANEDVALKASQAGSSPEKIDLNGSVVLPGIVDGHTHLVMLGAALNRINTMSLSISQIQAALSEARIADPNVKMLLGRSFLFDALGKLPHRKYLDEVINDIPVFIDSADLHSCWLNTAAITVLGITKDTPNPKGGSFEKDSEGELTGLFLETAVVDHVWPYLAAQLTDESRLQYLEDVFQSYLATGVTGATEMALEGLDLAALETVYDRNGGKLPVRVSAHWLVSPMGTAEDRAERVMQAVQHKERLVSHAPWLRIAGIKIIADGVVDSCTAYCSKAYHDGTFAKPIWPREELIETVALADKHGLQVAVHAIGDAAIDMALDAFENAIKVNGERPKSSPRLHRIEHLEVVNRESIIRLAKLGVVASLQPVHADPIYVPNWRKMLDEDERCDRAFPWSEYVDADALMAFGSDAPTAPHHCFPNMYTATTRQSGLDPSHPPSTDERIKSLSRFCVSLPKAIQNYTLGSAYSCQSSDWCGSLEQGKSADFCVLEIDPFENGLETLREAQEGVRETWLCGERVWCKE